MYKHACTASGVVMPMGSKVVLESPGSSEHNEEEESPDMDMDYLDDYDSDEEKRSHRKRKRVRRGRGLLALDSRCSWVCRIQSFPCFLDWLNMHV